MAESHKKAPVTSLRREIPGTNMSIAVRPESHPLVPVHNPGYQFRQDLVEKVLYGIESGEKVLLSGDAGVGKSSLVEQLASLSCTPLHRRNMHGATEPEEILGNFETPEAGKLAYREAFLPTAMREGHWVLFDEIDSAEQPVLFVLQMVLEDQGALALPDPNNTVIRPHPNFRLFATANTVGRAGANRLLYSGTMRRMNEATLDRFGVVVFVEPPDAELEMEIIMNAVPGFNGAFAEGLVQAATKVRAALRGEELTTTLSTRRLIQWARAMKAGFRPLKAAEFTVLSKIGPDDHDAVKGIIDRVFDIK